MPTRSAVLIVDAQVGVLAHAWNAERILARLQLLVQRARMAGVPVLWVQHADDELVEGSADWEMAPALVPAAGETVVSKRHNSAFADTDLHARLQALRVQRLVLAGAATNWCIRATAYAAVERGYDLALVADAHTTEPLALAEGRVVAAEDMVDDLNSTFRWLSAPGVTTEAANALDVVL